VDGVTWKEYETGLEGRLADLHNRIHRGAYQARASRRVYIAKADGRQRPLGIAALEDKVVQQAGAQPAPGAGCAQCGTPSEASELGAGCGHPWFL
jgi:hypothetical protein